ncbi:MAG: type IV pilus secretin PilQ [Proteobacteria bacterium]|nr:type IV pilus secretin PilQ [Pseudomonadota bacterium]
MSCTVRASRARWQIHARRGRKVTPRLFQPSARHSVRHFLAQAALSTRGADRLAVAGVLAMLLGAPGAGLAGAAPAASVPAKTAKQAKQQTQSASRANAVERASAARRPARLSEVSFTDSPTQAVVRIAWDGGQSPTWRVERARGALLLELSGAQLPASLQRSLDTSAFDGPVRSVSSFVLPTRPNTVQVRLALRGEPTQRLRREGRVLLWSVAKPALAGRAAPAVATDQQVAESYPAPKVAASASRAPAPRRQYSGRRIDLDFKDADIHNILRLLSEVGDVNIVTGDSVGGRVTIRMLNVPWDQALDVILRAKGLGQVREGNLLRVAPLADLEKEREAEIARQKQVMMLQPLETRLIPLSYAQASSMLAKLQYTLSPRGKVTFDARTNTVIARDVSSNLNLVETMIRNLDTQTPQVVIEARIIEARTNYTKQIGIQWGGSFAATAANGNSTGLVFPNQLGIGGGVDDGQSPTKGILLGQAANPGFAVNMPAATGLNSGSALGLTMGSVSGVFNVNLRLSAAESKGDIRIISAPKITTMDNIEAKIEQGVSIPFSQVSANGVQTQFRDAKLSLTVKPHVTADGSVIMKVNVERNEPDFVNTGPRGDPTILKKEAQTEMLVKDGDTAVIGGIYTTRDGRAWQRVPWFADIPILGWLFKTRRDTSDREEVLVFITPRIVNRSQSVGQ